MNGNIATASPRTVSVGNADDPYKRYWWAILGGFVLTGAWLCMPVMETSIGSVRVDAAKPAADAGAEQSLDSADNPGGAPGLNLSMDDIAKHAAKKGDDFSASMLYQAPDQPGALKDGAPLGSATGSVGSSASLAQQLKDVGKKDAGGWGEKAQRGFEAPHLGGGGLSGLGSGGGGSSASASAGGVGAFGAHNANVGFGAAQGLHDDGSGDKIAKGTQGSMSALRGVKNAALGAAGQRSGDNAFSSLSRAFDGAKNQNAIGGDVGGSAGGGSYAALDQAPVNLKVNDPKLDDKQLKEPDPPSKQGSNANSNQQMMQQMGMMLATAVIGGMLPGAGGQMAMMMGMMMMQQQQANAANQRSMDRQSQNSRL